MANRENRYTISLRVQGDGKVTATLEKVGQAGEKSLKRINKAASESDVIVRGLTRTITSRLLPAFTAASATKSLFQNIQTFERIDIRLRSLTNSAEDYADTQAYLSAKANELNVDLTVLSDGYAKLLALQKSGILNREQVNQLSEGLVNVGVALGTSSANIDRALFGLSQGLSTGTLRAEELNQVVEPLPGLLQELDRAAGLPAGGFRKLVNDGKVTSDFFATTMIQALQGFEGEAAKLDGTVAGSFTRLNNAWKELSRAIGDSVAIDGVVFLTEALADSISVGEKAVTGQMAFAEATTFVQKTAFFVARAIKAAFLVLQTSVLGLARALLFSLEKVQDGIVYTVNLIPGIEIEGVKAFKNFRLAAEAAIRDNAVQFVQNLDFGPDEETIKKIRDTEKRLQEMRRQAEIDRSKEYQAGQQKNQPATQTKEDKERIKAMEEERKKIEDVTAALRFRNEQVLRNEEAQELYNQLKAAGVELFSKEGFEIAKLVQEYFRLQEQKENERKDDERRKQLIDEIKQITEDNISVQDKYNQRMEKLNQLLKEGAISFEEFKAASAKAYEEMEKASDKWFDGAKRAFDDYAKEATDMAANVERVVSNAMQGLEDALVEATTTGKFEFKDMVDSIIEDVARLLVRTQITGPLAQGLSGLIGNIFGGQSGGGSSGGWFAKGAAFSDGERVTAYARGGIVGRPTLFPMAKGVGLMGEAGPEAVMPLTRTSSGRLGVEAIGGGVAGGNLYTINVDARGSSDPAATSESVKQAVDEALSARIPGIVQTSVQLAHRKTVDSWQRRGSRFE